LRRSPATGSPSASARRLPVWALACVLIAMGVATYASSFSGVFMGDDLDAIVDNRNLRELWPLTVTTTAPPDSTLAGRPVAAVTFALNYAMAPAAARDVMTPGPGASVRGGGPPDQGAHLHG
jgi:hypothetical protein